MVYSTIIALLFSSLLNFSTLTKSYNYSRSRHRRPSSLNCRTLLSIQSSIAPGLPFKRTNGYPPATLSSQAPTSFAFLLNRCEHLHCGIRTTTRF